MTKNKILNKIQAELCKKSLYDFLKTFWSTCDTAKFVDGWCIEYLCECFMYSVRYYIPNQYKSWWISDDEWSKIDGVCPIRDEAWKNNHNYTIPPRHTKTRTISTMGVCWLATINPVKIPTISHNRDLSSQINKDRQHIFESELYKKLFPEIELRNSSAFYIELSNGSITYSITQDGFTGFGGDIIINDDLTTALTSVKDGEKLETAKKYVENTLPTRLNDQKNGVIWNIQQRLAPNDVTGFIESKPALKSTYTFDVLKAIADDDMDLKFPCTGKVVHIRKGDFLWPERFGNYQSLKNQVGDRVFSTQYQQNPITSDMVVFQPEWFRIDNTINLNSYFLKYGSYDLPVKDKEKSDNAGVILANYSNGKLIVYDALETKQSYIDSKKFIRRVYENNPGVIQLVEDKANGSAIIQDLGQDTPGIIAFNPGSNSKVVRAEIASVFVKNGDVIFTNTNTPGMQHLFDRLTKFPLVDHDDLVDAFTQLVLYVFNDKQYSVYGMSFNKDNIVNDFKETLPMDYGIVKEGDLFKIGAVAIDYKKDKYILCKEWFVTELDDVVNILKQARIVYDASPNNEVTRLLNGILPVNGNNIDFQASVNLMKYGLSTNNIQVYNGCQLSIGEIEAFKWVKSAKDNGKEDRYASTDGIGAVLRIVVAKNKGINGVFY